MYTQTATHATLLERLSNSSDATAWQEFHARYGELIHRFARGRGLQVSDCDDILQDVLLSLSKSLPGFRYDPSKGKFRSYLKTMVLHAISKRMRQNRPGASLENVEDAVPSANSDPSAEALWEMEWRQHHVRNALKIVETEFRATDLEAFRRCALQDHEPARVAKELGISVDSVYQAKSRVLKRLSAIIEFQVADEG